MVHHEGLAQRRRNQKEAWPQRTQRAQKRIGIRRGGFATRLWDRRIGTFAQAAQILRYSNTKHTKIFGFGGSYRKGAKTPSSEGKLKNY
jgi:hypothetical protein